jgi:hypothetical protein
LPTRKLYERLIEGDTDLLGIGDRDLDAAAEAPLDIFGPLAEPIREI